MKRVIDVSAALLGLLVTGPVLLVTMFLVWIQDGHSPLYRAPRVGRDGVAFRMVKIRSMIIGADRTGVDSTASDDRRITAVGRFIRRYKLDELSQLWNVLRGDMSLVGPRPNVERDTVLYTAEEKKLLSVRPGITDLASIVFSDEGQILRGSADPDLRYNQVIRPWKSRLGLLYVERAGSPLLDLRLIWLTLLSALDRSRALERVAGLVQRLGGSAELARVAARKVPLEAAPPPGAAAVVQSRAGGQ